MPVIDGLPIARSLRQRVRMPILIVPAGRGDVIAVASRLSFPNARAVALQLEAKRKLGGAFQIGAVAGKGATGLPRTDKLRSRPRAGTGVVARCGIARSAPGQRESAGDAQTFH